MPLSKHIYLTGFMGSGKSSTGLKLAQNLGVGFADSDQILENRYGMTVRDLFLGHGEPFFRQAESRILQELANDPVKKVISLGGGVILSYSNRDFLKKGIWIFLDATPATILARIGAEQHRPLLGQTVAREDIEKLLRIRLPLYRLAPWRIPTDGLKPIAVAGNIQQLLRSRKLISL